MPQVAKLVFADKNKTPTSVNIFLVLCVYTVIVSMYTGVFFGVSAMTVRFVLSLVIVISYVILERSCLPKEKIAFLSPLIIIFILMGGAVYFKGDFLLFFYNISMAMISITYLKPRSVGAYNLFSGLVFALLLIVFRINLLGSMFSEIHNLLFFIASVGFNVLIYIQCQSTVKTLEYLASARDRARLAAKTKSSFLANMSHEIRTPLHAIIGLTEAELRRDLPEVSLFNLRKIHSSGNLLMGIINDILDMSKIESGRFDLNPAPYDIAETIHEVTALNMVRIGERPIVFRVNVDANTPRHLIGDELRIKQVLNNLLSNAFKYTDRGEVGLTVSFENEKDSPAGEAVPPLTVTADDLGSTCKVQPGSQVDAISQVRLILDVSDTGKGIAKGDLEKLFTEYTQASIPSSRHIEGTGLGLAISRGLAELMRGSITAESTLDEGSVFRFSMPQEAISQGASVPAPIGPEIAAALSNFDGSLFAPAETVEYRPIPSARVLVVDDLEINLEVATACMEPYEMTVDCLLSGKEAVEAVRAMKPAYDLIFMDHMMPGMDGIETLRAIRNLGTDYALRLPVIVLTANAYAGNDEMFHKQGFQGFLAKPIDLSQLDAVLMRWCADKVIPVG